MSFSKAKIQRFNDVKAPVTTINKQLTEKLKLKPKSSTHHCEGPTDVAKSDTASSQSVPCFRTPTLLKKKLKSTISGTVLINKSTTLHSVDHNLEALKEKLVEIENKDAYIKDLAQQLDDFKLKISTVEYEKENIKNEKDKYEKLLETLKIEHDTKIKTIEADYQSRLLKACSLRENILERLSFLREDFQNFQTFYRTDVQDLKNHCSELPIYFKKYSDQYQSLFDQKQAELDHQQNILKMLEQNSIDMQMQHSLEMENLRKEHQIEVQDLEFEMLKTMTDLQKEKEVSAAKIKEMEEVMHSKISEMHELFKSDKEQIIYESELKIKQLEESAQLSNLHTDTDIIEKLETEWKNKLSEQTKQSDAILKECQAISEYNIIQCTIEKNAAMKDLEENKEELKNFKKNYKELSEKLKELKATYEEVKSELNYKNQEFEELKLKMHSELEQCKQKLSKTSKEKSAYEYTIKNSQMTIEVLTKRLIHSDKDVEQLKDELSACEKKLIDYERKCLQLTSELKRTRTSNDELEMQFESAIKLNCKDIDDLGIQLLKEVNDYKKEVILYKKQFKDEQQLKGEIMQQLHDAYDMINRLRMEFQTVETFCSQHKFEMEQAQNELEDYRMREMDWNIIKDKLETTTKELEEVLESKSYEIDNLNEKLKSLEQKSDSLSQHSDYYKRKVMELEQEQLDTDKIIKNYVELSGKYDVLTYKYEELEAENLQNKMKVMKLNDEHVEDELKANFEEQLKKCDELAEKNAQLDKQLQQRLNEDSSSQSNYVKMKAERDELLEKCQLLEKELVKFQAHSKQGTPKSKKVPDDKDPKKWIKKNKHPKADKENICSPNRMLNSNRIESPLRDRN